MNAYALTCLDVYKRQHYTLLYVIKLDHPMIALPIKQESICSFAHFDLSCIFVYLLIILHRQIDSSKKTGSPSRITGLHRHRSMIRCDVFSFSASRLQLHQTRSVPLQLSAVLKLPLCQNLFPLQVCLHLDLSLIHIFHQRYR